MADESIKNALANEIERLSLPDQQRALYFVRRLGEPYPPSVRGRDLLSLAGTITHEEAIELREAIEEEWLPKPLDFLKYQRLEQYLSEDVRPRFHSEHSIGAFDFFSIVVWKAERAKSKVAKRLLANSIAGEPCLEPVVRRLTKSLYKAKNHPERLQLLLRDWQLRLPMASAVLTVFWPENFTIYDVRVVEQLSDGQQFRELANWTNLARIATGYEAYVSAVRNAAPDWLCLRNKDRYLWARSVAEQLTKNIDEKFLKSEAIQAEIDDGD